MRTSMLDALMPEMRQRILAVLLMQEGREWYLRDLSRHIGATPSSLQRELANLVAAGVLRQRRDGNRTYYGANPACPILPELKALLAKTAGLVDVLADALGPLLQRVDFAFVYGSMAAGEASSESDVDLMLVGDVSLADVAPALRTAEKRLSRAVNPSIYTFSEFKLKAAGGHHFLNSVIAAPRIFLKGTRDELAEALCRGASTDAPHQPS